MTDPIAVLRGFFDGLASDARALMPQNPFANTAPAFYRGNWHRHEPSQDLLLPFLKHAPARSGGDVYELHLLIVPHPLSSFNLGQPYKDLRVRSIRPFGGRSYKGAAACVRMMERLNGFYTFAADGFKPVSDEEVNLLLPFLAGPDPTYLALRGTNVRYIHATDQGKVANEVSHALKKVGQAITNVIQSAGPQP